MDGHQRQRHSKSIDGTYVPAPGDARRVQLAIITKKLINSTIIARSTAVDVFGKNAII
jgi:hypothetical protein